MTVRGAPVVAAIVTVGRTIVIVVIVVAVAALEAGQNNIPERDISSGAGSGKSPHTYEGDENSSHSSTDAFYSSWSGRISGNVAFLRHARPIKGPGNLNIL